MNRIYSSAVSTASTVGSAILLAFHYDNRLTADAEVAQEKAALSDYTDIDEDDVRGAQPYIDRITKHKSYLPTYADTEHLDANERTAITKFVKAHRGLPDFSLAKPKEAGDKKAKPKRRKR